MIDRLNGSELGGEDEAKFETESNEKKLECFQLNMAKPEMSISRNSALKMWKHRLHHDVIGQNDLCFSHANVAYFHSKGKSMRRNATEKPGKESLMKKSKILTSFTAYKDTSPTRSEGMIVKKRQDMSDSFKGHSLCRIGVKTVRAHGYLALQAPRWLENWNMSLTK